MNDALFNELLDGIREGFAIMRGEQEPSRTFYISSCNVHAIRKKFGFSQRDFAKLLGISVRTLQSWEKGQLTPIGSAKALLEIADQYPEYLLKKKSPSMRMKIFQNLRPTLFELHIG